MSHTPGPWGASGTMVVSPPTRTALERIQQDVQFTSKRICLTDNETYMTPEESEANAKLIAAAPTLLAACEAAYLAVPAVNVETLNQLRAAIAKATQ